ncbi:MAG: hypothetical protein J6K97_00670 [Clostridia bacterium]|nr:hypothetical protein [Clostridia bacterium]
MFKFLSMLLDTTVSGLNNFTWKGYFAKVFGIKNADVIPDSLAAAGTDTAKQKLYNNYQSLLAAEKAISIIETALWIVVGVVGLAAVIYAIFLGFQLAKAADQSKRDEAKKHLITVIIALVVTLVLVIFFLYLLPGILSAFKGTKL